jgi:hypothetical protein
MAVHRQPGAPLRSSEATVVGGYGPRRCPLRRLGRRAAGACRWAVMHMDHLSGRERLLRDVFQRAGTADLGVGDAFLPVWWKARACIYGASRSATTHRRPGQPR